MIRLTISIVFLSFCVINSSFSNDSIVTVFDRFLTEFNAENYEQSIELSKEALETSEGAEWREKLLEGIGLAYFRLERFEEAKHYTRKVVEEYPTSERMGILKWRLALIEDRLENYQEALSSYSKYIEQYPLGDYVISSLIRMDEINQILGKPAAEMSPFERLVKEFPDNPKVEPAKVRWAEHMRREGQYEEAIDRLYEFIREYPDSDYLDMAYFILAGCYRGARNPFKAQEYYKHVIENYPDSVWVPLANKTLNLLERTTWKTEVEFPPITGTWHLRSEIELTWKAIPTFIGLNSDHEDKRLISVIVKFSAENTSAGFISSFPNSDVKTDRDQPYKVRWDKGPGPYTITVDEDTGEPSREAITARATIIIKLGEEEIEGKSATSTFKLSEYLKTLQKDSPRSE